MPPLAADADVDWLSRDSCSSFCEQRRDKLKKDEEALELMRDELMRTQKETIVQGLCKLNKDVKKLSVKEFNARFGVDIIDVLKKQMAAGEVNASGGGGKKRFRGFAAEDQTQSATGAGLSLKTPAAHRLNGRPPMTRTAHRGERIICTSVNGSPVDQFDNGELVVTVKKRRAVKGNGGKPCAVANTPFPISIGIGTGNGETIDIADPDQRKHLDGEQKAQAMQQLMTIQEQMNKLMAEF